MSKESTLYIIAFWSGEDESKIVEYTLSEKAAKHYIDSENVLLKSDIALYDELIKKDPFSSTEAERDCLFELSRRRGLLTLERSKTVEHLGYYYYAVSLLK